MTRLGGGITGLCIRGLGIGMAVVRGRALRAIGSLVLAMIGLLMRATLRLLRVPDRPSEVPCQPVRMSMTTNAPIP